MPTDQLPPVLTPAQREALVELGTRGSGGSFDASAMSQLFALGLVDVPSENRALALTERGRQLLAGLSHS